MWSVYEHTCCAETPDKTNVCVSPFVLLDPFTLNTVCRYTAMTCRPDKYDTIQLIALLQQLLTHGGYYNADLEFINLERVQVTIQASSGYDYHHEWLLSAAEFGCHGQLLP